MPWQDDTIITPAPQRQPWEDAPIVQRAAPAASRQPWEDAPIAFRAPGPRTASGVGDALEAGWQRSVLGLESRGKLPDIQLDAHHSKWYESLAQAVGMLAGDMPDMVAGALAGGAVGGAAGSAVPIIGNVAGAAIGAGAGGFAMPAMVREAYMLALQRGDVVSSADFLDRTQLVLKAGGKEGLIGALTGGAGHVARLGAAAAGAGSKMTTAAGLTAEGGTMVVAPAALEGRMPEPEDFLNAAVLLVGLKGAHMAATKLQTVYARTGKTPMEVAADAKRDTTIAEDLAAPRAEPARVEPGKADAPKVDPFAEYGPELPRAYRELAVTESAREAVPTPSPEAARAFLDRPFAEVPQLRGEPILDTHVNYNYLNTPTEIQGAMSRLSGLYETRMREATRREVTWEQTYAEARKQFEDVTGERMPQTTLANADYAKLAADIYARKQILVSGAEQLMAKRAEYVTAAAEGRATDAMKLEILAQIDRVAQAQAAVRGSQAEVGRALNILKSTNRDKAYYDELTHLVNGRFGIEGELTGDANFAHLMDVLGDMGTPAQALKFAEKAAKATTWEKVVEAWKAGLVSGPVTQVANIMGNGVFAATRPLIDLAAVPFSKMSGSAERMSAVEPLARVVGNVQGVVDGARAAFSVLRTGDAYGGKLETHRKAIEGTVGEVVRVPFRLLSSADAFFRVVSERGEAYALATRQAAREGYNPATHEFRERVAEIATNPTDAMAEAIASAGQRFTFQAPLGEAGQSIQSTIKALRLEWAVPFVQTPANVAKEMLRLTPAAPIIGEWRAAIAKGGPEASKAIAEMAAGTATATAFFSMAMSGQISGAGDSDPRKRAGQLASGWQPYSVKVGNTWYSYQRLQPIGTLVGMAADAASAWEHMDDGERDKVPKILATAFANAITSQTFLQGITNIINAVSDPTRNGSRFLQGLAGSLVPAAVSQTAQMMDPYQREIDSTLDAVKARIPGLSETLQPKRDAFGEAVPARDRMGAITPITRSEISGDKVRAEVARLGVGVSKTPTYLELPAARDSKLGRVELTPQEQDLFATQAGHLAHTVLTHLVNSPSWDNTPAMAQRVAIETALERSRAAGRAAVLTPERVRIEATRISDELHRRLQAGNHNQ